MHKSENDLCHLPRAPVVFVRFELGIMRERVLQQEKIHTSPLRDVASVSSFVSGTVESVVHRNRQAALCTETGQRGSS